jgi:hypothetical protein
MYIHNVPFCVISWLVVVYGDLEIRKLFLFCMRFLILHNILTTVHFFCFLIVKNIVLNVFSFITFKVYFVEGKKEEQIYMQ